MDSILWNTHYRAFGKEMVVDGHATREHNAGNMRRDRGEKAE